MNQSEEPSTTGKRMKSGPEEVLSYLKALENSLENGLRESSEKESPTSEDLLTLTKALMATLIMAGHNREVIVMHTELLEKMSKLSTRISEDVSRIAHFIIENP